MNTLTPRQPGWVIFRGIRRSTRPGDIKHFHEPVKIIQIPYSQTRELGVNHAGSDTIYDIDRYDGTWKLITLELERIAT